MVVQKQLFIVFLIKFVTFCGYISRKWCQRKCVK